VGDLAGSSTPSVRRNRWDAVATIDGHDSEHAGANGATVTGAWGTGGQGSCVTAGGTCEISRIGIRNRLGSTTFIVQNVEIPGGSYDPGANDVSASIVIQRP
jgi:hypothetical protein